MEHCQIAIVVTIMTNSNPSEEHLTFESGIMFLASDKKYKTTKKTGPQCIFFRPINSFQAQKMAKWL